MGMKLGGSKDDTRLWGAEEGGRRWSFPWRSSHENPEDPSSPPSACKRIGYRNSGGFFFYFHGARDSKLMYELWVSSAWSSRKKRPPKL